MNLPKWTWPSSTWANTIFVAFPLNRPMPTRPWIGETTEAPSGLVDAWQDGLHAELELEVLHVPAKTQADPTGWYGATGWAAFLTHLRNGGETRFYYDRGNAVHDHLCQAVPGSIEDSRMSSQAQLYRVRMRLRDVNGTEFVI